MKKFILLIVLLMMGCQGLIPKPDVKWDTHINLNTTSQWIKISEQPVPYVPALIVTFIYPDPEIRVLQTLMNKDMTKIKLYAYVYKDELFVWAWEKGEFIRAFFPAKLEAETKAFFKNLKKQLSGVKNG